MKNFLKQSIPGKNYGNFFFTLHERLSKGIIEEMSGGMPRDIVEEIHGSILRIDLL